MTLVKVGWRALILMSLGTLAIGYADAQMSVHVKTVNPVMTTPTLDWVGSVSPMPTPVVPSMPVRLTPSLPPEVINDDLGGNISVYHHRWWRLASIGNPVEIRGGCLSACTLIVSHIPKERICVASGGYLGFHMAHNGSGVIAPAATLEMFDTYPDDIRNWITRNGGPLKLPGPDGNKYWTLYASDLWRMGYARCK